MSSLYTRLHRIFSSTQKATNSINSSTKKATNATKSAPKTPNAAIQKATNAIKLAPKTPNPAPTNAIESDPKKPNPTKERWMITAVKELLNEKDSDKLLEKFMSLSETGFFRRRHSRIYEFTVHRLALAKRLSLVEQALESQKKYICGEGFAARIIYLYGKAGMFDHAYKVFDELPERKCGRGAKSFHALLSAAVHSRKFDKAYELFRELPPKLSIELDVDCYNRVVYALCELGLFDNAVSLLDEMEANGLSPNDVSFNTLMCAFYNKGELERGERTWERMIKTGLVPDIHSYNFKLWGLVNEGNLTEAIELVEELKSKKLEPDLRTYNAMIKGSCENDDLEEAKRWYAELLEHDCVPNKITLSSLVPFLCEKDDSRFAFQVCEKKLKEHSFVIDESLLQNVVDGLVKNSMTEEAETLVKLAKSSSYVSYDLALPSLA